ncbi:MAG: site-2 protease family protein [Bacillota bacterium]
MDYQEIVYIILSLPWILLALSFHEFCHAWISFRLGDPTPEAEGRLSLNPLVHIDLLGMVALIFFRFGWAKPVRINVKYYKNPMKGMLLVSLAGPGGNFILALLFALLIRMAQPLGLTSLFNRTVLIQSQLINFNMFLQIGLLINLSLGFFNLIPVPPLDGSKVLRYFLRGRAGYFYDRFEQFGFFILILLLVVGVFNYVLNPLVTNSFNLLIGQ